MTDPKLDPETERHIRALRLYGQHPVITAAAAHIRQLATERDTARRCREINQEQREEWRAKCDAAQRELREKTSQLERVLDSNAEGGWMARALDAERNYAATKAELARLKAEAQLFTFGVDDVAAKVKERLDKREAKLATELAETKAELERLREAWNRYQRDDLSLAEFEGTVAEIAEKP